MDKMKKYIDYKPAVGTDFTVKIGGEIIIKPNPYIDCAVQ